MVPDRQPTFPNQATSFFNLSKKALVETPRGDNPPMDTNSAKVFCEQIAEKKRSIDALVSRLQDAMQTKRRLAEEQEKAKKCKVATERFNGVVLNALAILEKQPCANEIFDNFGGSSDPLSLGIYPTRSVKISEIVDLGYRLPLNQPMQPLPEMSILHIPW